MGGDDVHRLHERLLGDLPVAAQHLRHVDLDEAVLERTVLGGQSIKAGQRVALFYASANHDEDVFTDAFTFDITREVNPHLAFGGHGVHYCIGANLARKEIELIFEALADLAPDIKRTGEAVRLRSGWLNGIKELPVTYRG